jgi:hypothetical protein
MLKFISCHLNRKCQLSKQTWVSQKVKEADFSLKVKAFETQRSDSCRKGSPLVEPHVAGGGVGVGGWFKQAPHGESLELTDWNLLFLSLAEILMRSNGFQERKPPYNMKDGLIAPSYHSKEKCHQNKFKGPHP